VDKKKIYDNRRCLIDELEPLINLLNLHTELIDTTHTQGYNDLVKMIINCADGKRRLNNIYADLIEIKWGFCTCCNKVIDEEKIISLKKKLCYYWRKYKSPTDAEKLLDIVDDIVNCMSTEENEISRGLLDYFFSCEGLDKLGVYYHDLMAYYLNHYSDSESE
jgi:hypothetical protein